MYMHAQMLTKTCQNILLTKSCNSHFHNIYDAFASKNNFVTHLWASMSAILKHGRGDYIISGDYISSGDYIISGD